ncbi:hypothetical protein KIPB_002186 [Kipferlia bialata]|uniref:Uncharacterized protein n=1 Tax=Kipferlia bialata TaxID=797122 RepID=A0A9K3CQE3_9EUKA|nr:hypothetical protein KIPB_002186 [Kipferlia bialata]|eukprot:g2186.t1
MAFDPAMFVFLKENSAWPFVHFCYNFFPALVFQDAPTVMLGAYFWETFETSAFGVLAGIFGYDVIEVEDRWDSQLGDIIMCWAGLICAEVILRLYRVPRLLARPRDTLPNPEAITRLSTLEILYLLTHSFTHFIPLVKGAPLTASLSGQHFNTRMLKRWTGAVLIVFGMLLSSGPAWFIPDEQKFLVYICSLPIQLLVLYGCYRYMADMVVQDMGWARTQVRQFFFIMGTAYAVIGLVANALPIPTFFSVALGILCVMGLAFYNAPTLAAKNPVLYENGQIKACDAASPMISSPDAEQELRSMEPPTLDSAEMC